MIRDITIVSLPSMRRASASAGWRNMASMCGFPSMPWAGFPIRVPGKKAEDLLDAPTWFSARPEALIRTDAVVDVDKQEIAFAG